MTTEDTDMLDQIGQRSDGDQMNGNQDLILTFKRLGYKVAELQGKKTTANRIAKLLDVLAAIPANTINH